MQKLQGFQYATALADLNMGYYYIRLDADSLKLCTIIFPWETERGRIKGECCKVHFWATAQIEYLGYWITRTGIKPLETQVKPILDLEAPTNVKQTLRVLGIVIQYYWDIWEKRSHILAPLTNLVAGQNKDSKKNTKFIWTDKCQRAFNELKKIVARDVMLAYPDFKKLK
eukprot:scaffold63059_cov67-Attheya_sp.AAC.2